jgi:hypothetical protein
VAAFAFHGEIMRLAARSFNGQISAITRSPKRFDDAPALSAYIQEDGGSINRRRESAMRLFLLLSALLPVLAACGGDDGDSDGRAATASPAAGATSAPTKASGEVLLASTTSTEDSGLLDVLIPAFEEQSGYDVTLISGGSGQAIESGRRGDVDVLLVHSPAAEKELVAEGFGIERAFVMHNDFVLVGPPADPAGASEPPDITNALQAIASTESTFISRGDDSGTHVTELRLWETAGIDPSGESWYAERNAADRQPARRLRADRPWHIPRAARRSRAGDHHRGRGGHAQLLPRHRHQPGEAR